jgi:hypothetical protein
MMESLAFNIMARIDDLLYVDDATKQRATAESVSPCVQGKFSSRPSKQKSISSSHVSFQHSFSSSMPTAGSSGEVIRIPNGRKHHSLKKSNLRDSLDQTLEKLTF